MLSAACDQYKGMIDVPKAIARHTVARKSSGVIASLLRPTDGMFHRDRGEEDDMIDPVQVYINLGDDPPEALDKVLAAKVRKALENGMSPNGAEKLEQLFKEHRSVFE